MITIVKNQVNSLSFYTNQTDGIHSTSSDYSIVLTNKLSGTSISRSLDLVEGFADYIEFSFAEGTAGTSGIVIKTGDYKLELKKDTTITCTEQSIVK